MKKPTHPGQAVGKSKETEGGYIRIWRKNRLHTKLTLFFEKIYILFLIKSVLRRLSITLYINYFTTSCLGVHNLHDHPLPHLIFSSKVLQQYILIVEFIKFQILNFFLNLYYYFLYCPERCSRFVLLLINLPLCILIIILHTLNASINYLLFFDLCLY